MSLAVILLIYVHRKAKRDNLFRLFDHEHFDGHVFGNQLKTELVEQSLLHTVKILCAFVVS